MSCYSDHDEDIRTKGSCDYCGGTALEGDSRRVSFVLHIQCDNAAFEDDMTGEVARLLRQVSGSVDQMLAHEVVGEAPRAVLDANGNTVGSWFFGEAQS